MPTFKGITCTVNINGIGAKEYGFETDGATATCSIVSQDDVRFTFGLNFSQSPAERHEYWAYADGLPVASFTTAGRTVSLLASSRPINGGFEQREMRFAKLETVDQKAENLESRPDILKNIGTLMIKVWRAQFRIVAISARDTIRLEEADKVHEKSLKGRGVSHKTSYGTATYTNDHTFQTVKLDPTDSPYVIFIFRYANRSHLQSEGLIPRSPSPSLAIKNYDGDELLEEMSAEALRREVIRLRNESRLNRPLKREPAYITKKNSRDDSDDDVIIKSVRDLKKPKFEKVEVIDLVDDDH